MNVTTSEYYAAFSSYGLAISGAVAALPLLSLALKDAVSSYAFPPLGGIEGPARLGACGFCAFATYIVFLLWNGAQPNALRKRAGILFVSALVLFVGYLAAYHGFVRTIEIPAQHSSLTVSVGFTRTEGAKRAFGPEISDEEMLRDRGMTEEEIKALWTGPSIVIARLTLLILYLACAACLVGLFSLGALKHAVEQKAKIEKTTV